MLNVYKYLLCPAADTPLSFLVDVCSSVRRQFRRDGESRPGGLGRSLIKRQQMHQMLLGLALAANVAILKALHALSLGVPENLKTNVSHDSLNRC